MSFWKIAWRNIQQRALASALTALSMALGVAVMIAVIVVYGVTVRQFEQNPQGYHLIVGGRGGSLQLVLSTVYHIGQPLYPIPYTYYQQFIMPPVPVPMPIPFESALPLLHFDKVGFASQTELAIPMCLGDSYEAPNGTLFRVVGTTPDRFDKIHYGTDRRGNLQSYEFEEGGRNLRDAIHLRGKAFHEAAFEAVVGSVVASQAGLELGDEIHPTHGIGGEGHEHEGFKLVGILKPTGTADDRAVFINIEGFYRLEDHARTDKAKHGKDDHAPVHAAAAKHDHHGEAAHDEDAEHKHKEADHDHDKHGHETKYAHEHKEAAHDEHQEHKHAHDHDEHDHGHHHHHHHAIATEPLPIEQREVTSILVLGNNPMVPQYLAEQINKSDDRIAQAVAPMSEVATLMDRIVGPIRIVLLVLTVLVVIVAGISILVSIYNSMSERSHDIAVMRALGASRNAVMAIILVESILLSVGGGLIGILLGHGLIGLASPYVVERTGIALSLFEFDWQELVLIPGLVVLASLVGFLPALAAYRTDVAKALSGSR